MSSKWRKKWNRKPKIVEPPTKKQKLTDNIETDVDGFLDDNNNVTINNNEFLDTIIEQQISNDNDNEFIMENDEFDDSEFKKLEENNENTKEYLFESDSDNDGNIVNELKIMNNETELQNELNDIKNDIKEDWEYSKQNDEELKVDFVFPSKLKLNKEKSEAPDLKLIKDRIENILKILTHFRILKDNKHTRKEYLSLLSDSMARYYGYNVDLINMFLELFNHNECLAFLEGNEKKRPMTIRVNTLKCRRRDLAKMLIDRGINLDPLAKWSKEGLKIVNTGVPIGATPEYLGGYYIIQSASSLLPVYAMGIPTTVNNKFKVLDMSCAPGGKTTHIAQLMKNNGVLIANDVNKIRQKATFSNIHRMGIKNTIIVNHDGREISKMYNSIFDRVLLDAPCSCLGVISRDNSIKYSKKFDDVVNMSILQKELLLNAIDACKVGGIIVYSTCSISIYENESVVDYAMNHRYIKILDTKLGFGVNGLKKFKNKTFHNDLTKTKRFYPHIHNLDGFYVAKMMKLDKKKRGEPTLIDKYKQMINPHSKKNS